MNKLERIGLEKLRKQLYKLKDELETATQIRDSNGNYYGHVSVSLMHRVTDIDNALETITAIEENDNPSQK